MRLESDVASSNRFYTDLNGFQVISSVSLSRTVMSLLSCVLIGPLLTGADAAAPDSEEAPPAGQLLPDELLLLPAGLTQSSDAAVGAEPGRGVAAVR